MNNIFIKRLKIVVLLGILLSFVLPAHGNETPDGEGLTIESMIRVFDTRMKDRKKVKENDRQSLFDAMQVLEILTDKQLDDLFSVYFPLAVKSEKRICREILESYKKDKVLSSTEGFSAEKNDLRNIRKGRYFTQAGMVREMLILKYGEEKEDIIRGGPYGDEDDPDYEELAGDE